MFLQITADGTIKEAIKEIAGTIVVIIMCILGALGTIGGAIKADLFSLVFASYVCASAIQITVMIICAAYLKVIIKAIKEVKRELQDDDDRFEDF